MKTKRVLTGLLITIAAAFALAGCAGETFTAKAYVGEAGIAGVDIRLSDRTVELVASPDDRVRIEYYDSEKEYLSVSVSEENILTVELTFDKDWTDYIGTKPAAEYRRLTVAVPAGVLEQLAVATTNGDITASGVSVSGAVTLSSNGGNVVCERIDAGTSITLTAKNGDVTGTIAGGWDDFAITCSIKKGESNLPEEKPGGAKSLRVDCNNGDVALSFVS